MRRLAWFAVLISAAALGQKAEVVEVLALADGQNCRVLGQQMACDAVGAYLKNTRHLPAGYSALVLPVAQTSMPGALTAGRSLEAAGYSDTFKVGFITAPAPSSDSKP